MPTAFGAPMPAERERRTGVYAGTMGRALIFTLLAVSACALPGSFVGRSEADLRAGMGTPEATYDNADGSRTLAYSTGRLGTQTYMAEVDPGGAVRAVRAALNDETFMRIRPGMTRDQVLRLIGPPRETMRFDRLGRDSWEYYFIDTWGYYAFFSVDFDANGIVVDKLTRRRDYLRSPR